MEEVEVGENREGPEEPGSVERSAEAASELGLEAGSGAGEQMRLGGPLQGRGTGKGRPGREWRPGKLRTAKKGVDAARKLEQGGQARTGAVDKVTEDLETGEPGGGVETGTWAYVEEVADLLGTGRPG